MGVAQELRSFALGGRNVGLVSLPGPVARGHARNVHARIVAQPQDILQRHHHERSITCQRVAHQLGRHLNTARSIAARKGTRAPPGQRRRIVRRGVQDLARRGVHAATDVVVAKLQHVHAGEAAGQSHGANARRQIAQVLSDKVERTQLVVGGLEQVFARSRQPATVGAGLTRRNAKVAVESQEVIQTHAVVERERATQAIHPPAIAVLLHVVPSERRVAPHLALGRKVVGRRTGNLNRLAGFGQPEVLGLAPRIGRIVRDIHRNVADDLDTLLVRIVHKLAPGQVKAVLHVRLQLGLVVETLVVDQMLVVARDICRPIVARLALKVLLNGHVNAVLLEPVGVAMFKRRVQRVGILTAASLPGNKVGGQLLVAFGQQIDIARKGRGTGVRGSEEIRRVDGQDLPVAHAHCGQMVDKATCGSADRTGLAIVGGHRGDMAHDTRAVIKRLL